MAFETKKDLLQARHPGVGADRIVERTQGCWNCVHFSREKARDLWWNEARGSQLNKATIKAIDSPLGENTPIVRNIREMVPKLDAAIEAGELGCCRVGKLPDGQPVGDFVHQSYLCRMWTGAEGASVAREGQKADDLPEEVMEKTFPKNP